MCDKLIKSKNMSLKLDMKLFKVEKNKFAVVFEPPFSINVLPTELLKYLL